MSDKDIFDPKEPHEVLKKEPAIPRDAATMILYRRDEDAPRILMGQRSNRHDFMPDKFVFPGGSVDAADGDVPTLSELGGVCENRLATRADRSARTFALAAIRETFEEAGIFIGRHSPRSPADNEIPPAWRPLYARGLAPCLENITFIGQAITPPIRPKRFDARFFLADRAKVTVEDTAPADSTEMAHLSWFTLEEAFELDLPRITRFVLSEVAEWLDPGADNPQPFFAHWVDSNAVERFE